MRERRVHSRILDRYVLRDEQVVVAIRHHWGRMIEPVLTTLIGLLVASWISTNAPIEASALPLVLWWLWFALVLRLLWKALEWRNEWFVATDKRLLMTYGLITHKVAMMPLRKVTDMNYARSPLGRVLGYGQFIMESAGQDQAMREINWVPDPDDTYRRICDTIFGPEGRDPDDDPFGERAPETGASAYDSWEETDDQDEPDSQEGPVWEVSREDAAPYAPAGFWEDPDITGPIPRPRRK
ncbi:PH domain-containing protein [Ornithinimicrobium faecis]|uniref:PH domain-containing protein n=1 Tax=Ornithinimicrobium faecis TaxID=2934158 RepID=A0ABY4YUM3_9MICO|nr:PH domain-containing protein [Ornithinimicrobium sp. HY1793]USQ80461.1 PH domain-containing protein [Ornithinimicrobium sp. HY1793]